jgi:hypothetical protein
LENKLSAIASPRIESCVGFAARVVADREGAAEKISFTSNSCSLVLLIAVAVDGDRAARALVLLDNDDDGFVNTLSQSFDVSRSTCDVGAIVWRLLATAVGRATGSGRLAVAVGVCDALRGGAGFATGAVITDGVAGLSDGDCTALPPLEGDLP